MNRFLAIALLFCCFGASAQEKATKHNKPAAAKSVLVATGKVTGDIKNMPAQKVELELLRANDAVTVVDSAHSDAAGHFALKVKSAETQLYRVHLGSNKYIFLSIGKENVELSANFNDIDNYKIANSQGSEELSQFITNFRNTVKDLNTLTAVMDSLKKSGQDSLMAMANQDFDGRKAKFAASVKHTAATTLYQPVAILAARLLNPATDGAFLADFNKSLPKRFPGTIATKDFNEFYDKATQPKQTVNIGDIAPEVKLQSPDGKEVALSSLKGHYVLLDFWASWCGPCRGENPNVVAAYNKFKSKNFTIYGVSLDSKKDAWEAAIHADGLAWTQVSELKGWQSAVAGLYSIQSIPQNFLIDPSGKIIAHNLRGEELQKTLESTLK